MAETQVAQRVTEEPDSVHETDELTRIMKGPAR